MPIREYILREGAEGCDYCSGGFEEIEKMDQEPLQACPRCGSPVMRCFSTPAINTARTNLDDRARSAGFKKYKRLGKGEYEKQY